MFFIVFVCCKIDCCKFYHGKLPLVETFWLLQLAHLHQKMDVREVCSCMTFSKLLREGLGGRSGSDETGGACDELPAGKVIRLPR